MPISVATTAKPSRMIRARREPLCSISITSFDGNFSRLSPMREDRASISRSHHKMSPHRHKPLTNCRLSDRFGEKQENRISLEKKIADLSHLFHIAISLYTTHHFNPQMLQSNFRQNTPKTESTATFRGHLYLGEVVIKQPGREYSFLPDSAYKGA